MTILIPAASGHLAPLVIDALIARGTAPAEIVAGARRLESIAALAERGIRTVRFDYDDVASLDAALEGVTALLLVSGSEVGQRVGQHGNVIRAAKEAGVARLVYTSAPKATTSALILAPEHKATEELIEASGIPATILRNNWYTENYAPTVEQARATGEVVASAGQGRVASASRVDYAEAAAVVLTEPGHEGKVYELSGDVAWNFDEFAAAVSEVIDSPVAYRSVSSEEQAQILASVGLDEGTVGFLVGLDANICDGLLAETSGELSRLIGRPTTPLRDGLAAIQ